MSITSNLVKDSLIYNQNTGHIYLSYLGQQSLTNTLREPSRYIDEVKISMCFVNDCLILLYPS
jgi:hypothetical protein